MSNSTATDPSAAAAAAAALQQLLELHDDARIVAYCAVGAYTWFLFDFFTVLPSEIRYVWATKWNLSKLLFAWVRIFGTVLLTVNLAVTMTGNHSVKFCQFYFYWEGTAGSLMLYSVEVILQLRIYAMYHKNKWLALFNAAFFLAEIIVMLTVYNYGISVGTTLATPEGLTGCYGITTSYLFSIWLPGLAFEMWLVVLAIWKAIERARSGIVVNGQRLDLLALLIRDNVVYFVVIALGLLTNTVMWFAAPDGLAASAVSMSHASMIVSGTRLLLNLFEAFHRRVQRSRGATTTGAYYNTGALTGTEDASTLPTFRAAKRDLSQGTGTRSGWADTAILTTTDWTVGTGTGTEGTESTVDVDVDDYEDAPGRAETQRDKDEAAVRREMVRARERRGVYRLENLYGANDGGSYGSRSEPGSAY